MAGISPAIEWGATPCRRSLVSQRARRLCLVPSTTCQGSNEVGPVEALIAGEWRCAKTPRDWRFQNQDRKGKRHETSGISENRRLWACRVHHYCRTGHRAVDAGDKMALYDELAKIA